MHQKLISLALCLCLAMALTGCGPVAADEEPAPLTLSAETSLVRPVAVAVPPQPEDSSVLIVFFSRAGVNYKVGRVEEGNTALVAAMIADATGADMFELVPAVPYSDDFDQASAVSLQEQQTGARPEYVGDAERWDQYDTVFLGYPVWWGDMPMILYTFLESHDFTGKTVVPFCTHEGSSLAGTVTAITDLCPGASVEAGLAVQGERTRTDADSVQKEVAAFLAGLDLGA